MPTTAITAGDAISSALGGSAADEPFDPLAEGRAGDPTSHISLRLRGKVLLKLREEKRRRQSYSVHTRRVSTALLGAQGRVPTGLGPRRGNTRLRFIVNEGDDHLDEILDASLTGAGGDDGGQDKTSLIISAVLALWENRRVALGFRRWKEIMLGATDPARLPPGVNLNDEARRILMAAEKSRQGSPPSEPAATATGGPPAPMPNPSSPRHGLSNVAVRIPRNELDLLIVWARQMQSRTFRGVDDASICEVMRHFRFRQYDDGDALFFEGESGETFYVILQGTVAVFVGMHGPTKARLRPRHHENRDLRLDWPLLGKRVFTYRTGDSFGETAMFSTDATRTATAIAIGPCEVFELHRDVYRRTLRKYHQQFFEQAQKLNFLMRVPLFRDLQRHRLTAIAEVLEKRRLNFGDALLTERQSVLQSCFLVLLGQVKLTQSLDIPTAPGSSGRMPKTRNRGMHMNVELQTIVPNEIVALEALVGPNQRATYSAVAASASVEIFVLKESDARGFVGVPQSSFHQRIRRICDDEARVRAQRVEAARGAILGRGAAREDAVAEHERRLARALADEPPPPSHGVDTLDLIAAAPESPRGVGGGKALTTTTTMTMLAPVPGLQIVPPPVIGEGAQAPFLPNLRASRLFPEAMATGGSPRWGVGAAGAAGAADALTGDLSVVVSPKMLSTCARKFLFEHSETLSADYVERLSHQLAPWGVSAATARVVCGNSSSGELGDAPPVSTMSARRAREEQRVLEQQLAKMYDSKMHWDPQRREFVVVGPTPPPPVIPQQQQQRPSAPGRKASSASAAASQKLHQQLQSTQQTARRLVETHLKRVSHQQSQPTRDAAGSCAFLHFFADS